MAYSTYVWEGFSLNYTDGAKLTAVLPSVAPGVATFGIGPFTFVLVIVLGERVAGLGEQAEGSPTPHTPPDIPRGEHDEHHRQDYQESGCRYGKEVHRHEYHLPFAHHNDAT